MAVSPEPHIPVLLDPILSHVRPLSGIWLDGTMGAGGYTRAFLDEGADRVIAIDRDPGALASVPDWSGGYSEKLTVIEGCFGDMHDLVDQKVDGVVLDIGVSSMQLDQAARGFSFMKDGPLDMRMAQSGPSAADIVNNAPEGVIADILFQFGEERASRKIASAIVMDRDTTPFTTTRQLAGMIERIMPRPKPGQPHAATRSFQALRIIVNDELGELARGLQAAEKILKPDGLLVVVTFHSLEDRMVKRFMQTRSGSAPKGNRYAPVVEEDTPRFIQVTRKAVTVDNDEMAVNPRSRSAKLRIAKRTDALAGDVDFHAIGLPKLAITPEAWA